MRDKVTARAPIALVLFLIIAGGTARAQDGDARELKARTDFAAGEYRPALELFAQLYAETLHPTYLRNVGRCHQMLGDHEKAIKTFREFLRKAKDLRPDERAEVEAFIGEMEASRRVEAAGGESAGGHVTAATSAAAPPAPPLTRRWWFWTGLGTAVVAGVVAAMVVSRRDGRVPCPADAYCPR